MNSKSIAIVGSGPAAFYCAMKASSIWKLKFPESLLKFHMFESKCVPFGLIRDGVAPDHADVKNCTEKFTKWADESFENGSFRWFGNLTVGSGSLPLQTLTSSYDAVVIAAGAYGLPPIPSAYSNQGKTLSCNALDFVHWYNGNPSNFSLLHNTMFLPAFSRSSASAFNVVIVGVGNVAVDCARILLAPRSRFQNTDMPRQVLDTLHNPNDKDIVRNVTLVARRGPRHVAFTAKEIRELAGIVGPFYMSQNDLKWLKSDLEDVQDRKTRRILEILEKNSTAEPPLEEQSSRITIRFGMRIDSTNESGLVTLKPTVTHDFKGRNQIPNCSLLIQSIGNYPVNIDPTHLSYDVDKRRYHFVEYEAGLISSGCEAKCPIYATGWSLSGAKGVLATTLQTATATAHHLTTQSLASSNFSRNPDPPHPKSNGSIFEWEDWKAMSEMEEKQGYKLTSCIT